MEKKIVVPEGMLKAFYGAETHDGYTWEKSALKKMLAVALLWLSENPIMPTNAQLVEIAGTQGASKEYLRTVLYEWQRRMLIAPEPEVPEAVNDLLCGGGSREAYFRPDIYNERIVEAFRRGQRSK